MARTINDVLADMRGELTRISACYNLDKAADRVHDSLALIDMSQAEREFLEQAENDLKQGWRPSAARRSVRAEGVRAVAS